MIPTRLRRGLTGYAGPAEHQLRRSPAQTSTSCRSVLGACLTSPRTCSALAATFCRERVRRGGEMQKVHVAPLAATFCRERVRRGGEMQKQAALRLRPEGEAAARRASGAAARRGERGGEREVDRGGDQRSACKAKVVSHEYPPQKRKSLLTYGRRITVGQS